MWPRPIGLDSHRILRCPSRRGRGAGARGVSAGTARPGRDRRGLDRTVQDEVADEAVHLRGVAAVEAVAAALEGHQARARNGRDHLLRVRVRDDLVLGPVHGQRRDGDPREEVSQVDVVDGPQGLDEHVGRGLARPGDAVLHALERVGLREHALEQARDPVVVVPADHRRHPLLEGAGQGLGVLGGEEEQVGEPRGVRGRVPEREESRAGEREEGEGRPRHLLEDRQHVAVAGLQVVARGGPVRAAVAAGIHRDHPEVAREVRDLMLPHAAVDDHLTRRQQEQIARAAAGHLVEDPRVGPVHVHGRLRPPGPVGPSRSGRARRPPEWWRACRS